MNAYEHRTLDHVFDEKGNLHINYPMTKSSCVKTKDGLLDNTLSKGLYIGEGNTEEESSEEEVLINADRLEGKSAKYFEQYADNTKNRTWEGNPISMEYGGTGLNEYTSNSIIYIDSNKKITLLEKPDSDSIFMFKDGAPTWISLEAFKSLINKTE